MNFNKIKAVYKPTSDRAVQIIKDLPKALSNYPWEIVEHRQNLELEVGEGELILSIGGDGTFISVLRNLYNPHNHAINICGINAGNRGFLCSYEMETLETFKELLLKREFPFRTRKRYLTSVIQDEGIWERHFVNETTISANHIARLQKLILSYGEVVIDEYLADGLIISSPQGSTAYNLAAGGAIVHHELEAYSVTPICPHKLTHRSLVLPDYRDISVSLAGQSGLVTLDGQETREIEKGDTIKISQTKEKIFVMRNPHEKYVDRIRSKLLTTDRDW